MTLTWPKFFRRAKPSDEVAKPVVTLIKDGEMPVVRQCGGQCGGAYLEKCMTLAQCEMDANPEVQNSERRYFCPDCFKGMIVD